MAFTVYTMASPINEQSNLATTILILIKNPKIFFAVFLIILFQFQENLNSLFFRLFVFTKYILKINARFHITLFHQDLNQHRKFSFLARLSLFIISIIIHQRIMNMHTGKKKRENQKTHRLKNDV